MPTFRIIRDKVSTDGPTMGELVAGDRIYQTMELPWRENAAQISCIPTGTYGIVMQWSPKFGRKMPTVLGVHGRSNILIHPANHVEELQGCVAIGARRDTATTLAFGARVASDAFNRWFSDQPPPTTVDISYAEQTVELPRMQQVT